MTLVFGLTGGLASGKSTVAARLVERGIPLIAADALAREVVEPGSPGLVAVIQRFGAYVLNPDGTLDRRRLAARVFEDAAELAALNAIVHPLVRERFLERVRELSEQGHPLVGYEVPLLFENQLEAELRPVVLVAAPESMQIERAMARDGLSRSEALARLRAQLPLGEKLARADLVIWNDKDLDALRRETDPVIDELLRRAARHAEVAG